MATFLLTLSSMAVEDFRQRLDIRPPNGASARFHSTEFTPAGRQYDTLLVLGGSSDHHSGGRLLEKLVHHLLICIDEKTRKIAPYRSRYPEWWLALEDRISYGALDTAEVDKLRDALRECSCVYQGLPRKSTRADNRYSTGGLDSVY